MPTWAAFLPERRRSSSIGAWVSVVSPFLGAAQTAVCGVHSCVRARHSYVRTSHPSVRARHPCLRTSRSCVDAGRSPPGAGHSSRGTSRPGRLHPPAGARPTPSSSTARSCSTAGTPQQPVITWSALAGEEIGFQAALGIGACPIPASQANLPLIARRRVRREDSRGRGCESLDLASLRQGRVGFSHHRADRVP